MEDYKVGLRAARVNAGMSQKCAADLLGITPETLAKWESGKTAPRVTMLPKISEIYSIPIDLIFLPNMFGLREQKTHFNPGLGS